MKACILKEKNQIVVENIDIPKISHLNQVLIKIHACGICSSDFNRVYGTGAYFYPLILGHEFSGEIIDVSANLDSSLIGKRTVVFPLLPCFECEFCKRKMFAQCQHYSYFGSRTNGAMTEFLIVPFWNIKLLRDDTSYDIAALCEPTAVAVNAVRKISNLHRMHVCISGTGTIAVLVGLLCNEGQAKVTFIVRNPIKIDFLKSLGFTNFIDLNEAGRSLFDVVFECVGSNLSLANSINSCKSGGALILLGNPEENLNLNKKVYWKILRSELHVYGVWNSNYRNSEFDDWDIAIDFLSRHELDLKKVITDKFRFEDGLAAFEKLIEKGNSCHLKGMFIND